MANASSWRRLVPYLVLWVLGANLLIVTPVMLISRFMPEAEQIAFMYNPPDLVPDWDIYLLDTRTGVTVPVIDSPAQDRYPEWSPDGERLAYHANPENVNHAVSEGAPFDPFIADNNGENIRELDIDPGQTLFVDRLLLMGDVTDFVTAPLSSSILWSVQSANNAIETAFRAQTRAPNTLSINKAMVAWSPDGSRVAFHVGSGYTTNYAYQIYISTPDGSNYYPVIEQPYPGEMIYATWSPDGSKLAYVVDQSQALRIAAQNTPGNPSTVPPTTTFPAQNGDCLNIRDQISPDLTGLEPDLTNPNTPHHVLYMVDVGTELNAPVGEPEVVMASGAGEDILFPAWSPDGQMIAFSCMGRGDDLYTVNVENGEVKQLTVTDFRVDNMHPDWTPDGERVMFVSNQDGDFDIYTVKPDGTDIQRMTNLPGDEWAPDWRPRAG